MVDVARHRIDDPVVRAAHRERLDHDGALVLEGFLRPDVVERLIADHDADEANAFFAAGTHNAELTEPLADLPADHPRNRQIVSSKGLIADDQIPDGSPLRTLYDSARFRAYLASVLGIGALHPYADRLSSINVHFAPAGRELGWHLDNSSFAVTLLLRAPLGGGRFEYVPGIRNDSGDGSTIDSELLGRVLDGDLPPLRLDFAPGALVLFRGREALHRVTPTIGGVTRLLVVLAYNDAPGIALSPSALATFYGREP